ncbi:MAG TPA: hypothetical protein VGS99_05075, partial [Gammaproteobacteria bacterium]|nr:hypothetical protein [Gammaproteobacteria bacterium]
MSALSWIFLAAGLVLAAVELATTTFYLAALALSCLLTALGVWLLGLDFGPAAVVFAIASVVLLPVAHHWRKQVQDKRADELADMDKGGAVTVESDQDGKLKVRYRDSIWDADWDGPGKPA